MSLLKRLKQLEAAIDETGLDEIMVSPGWVEYVSELEQALPKLLAVVEAARYQALYHPEDTVINLQEALQALEEGEG